MKGLATGSKSRRQGNSTEWINSVTYYDTYYQPIQTISTHQLTGTVKTSTLYAFSGEVEKTVNTYSYSGGTTRVERRFTYDHAGRPLKVFHKINGNDEVMLGHFQYNELGEATDIIHHSRNNGNTWLYKTGLKSTIQGWTDEILYTYSNGDPVFRQKLDYHKASGTSNTTRLDGIITSNQWKHYGTEPERAYNYTYDTPKRLTGSIYRQKTGSTWNSDGNFNESHISYSANGNITALRRNRDNGGTVVQMDQLTYTYTGNQLTAVADAAPAAHKAGGFNDGNTGTDYTYNQNGFLLTDANKGITGITYTRQDLPAQINFGTNNIKYTYSAGGGLMTVSYTGTNGFPNRTQQYVGELVFEGTTLKEIRHEYGRVLADAGYRYQYYLTDHLGNTRVVLQEDPANFTVLATFEPDNLETESMQFMDYGEAPHIASSLFDHTGTSETGYALRLTNGENGPSRSVAVLPGDTVRMEVFAKYLDLNNKKTDPALMMLSLAIEAANPGSPGIDGNLSTASSRIAGSDQGLAGLLVGKEKRNDAPPAYLNYLFFDKEMNYKYGGYVQMTEAGYEDGTNREHERLYSEVVADEPGYFYIYLSNDGTEGGEAYFDDFSILTLESYIVQQTDYYPYGLIARNFVRAGEKETKELFQGKTYDELTGWYDFHARQYDAALGRWFGVDPQNQFASPYLAMGNNPVMYVDPDGEFVFIIPQIGFSKNGGLSLGLEVGVGIPGVLSASVTGGFSTSGGGYWSAQGYAGGFYGGYGSSGAFVGWGYRYAGFNAGVGYSKGGWNAGIGYGGTSDNFNGSFGIGWSQKGGFDLNSSAGYTKSFTSPQADMMTGGEIYSERNLLQNSDLEYYYNTLDKLVLPDGQIISREELLLTMMSHDELKKIYPNIRKGNSHYLGYKDGKHHVNFSIADYETTKSNIRAVAIHEVYGHGIKGYSDAAKNHHKAYFASIDSKYWTSTTTAFRTHTAQAMWLTWTRAGNYGGMPAKYMNVIYNYHPHYRK
ncbi:hypothetical protein ADIS_1277 [Lunatimonas lonarensis]|uniref:Rhs family protein n=1 Tax=Lunatimonas lonarensis TaxID=1232681 RepID=R7ZVD2_9BACT|nr:RHS repeat-associated core domain-containing protein [Lunatimonas lonarensis]EON78080.1 hypothetical protein ADIS_1277 [Lunatimonas lonarensis]